MEWDVKRTNAFAEWFRGLDEDSQETVAASIGLLKEFGPNLRHPHSSGINGSKHGHMRELRIQHKGNPIRAFYAFAPHRSAILLVAADKKGESDKQFYGRMVPVADKLYDGYLDYLKRKGKDDGEEK